jgi:head-tail adaptor
MERFNLRKLSMAGGTEEYHGEVSNRLVDVEVLHAAVETNSTWEMINGNNKISSKESLGY